MVVQLREGVEHATVLKTGEGVQLQAVDPLKNTLFDVGIRLFQLPQQEFDLLPLAAAHAVPRRLPFLREPAGALEELQVVVVLPCDDGVLVDAVQGPDQFHAGEILAAELGGHGLKLSAVEQAHDGGLDHVGKVVAQRDLVASQFLSLGIQEAPAHPGAEIAGVLLHADGDIENVAVENRDGDSQQGGVILDEFSILRLVAGVHHHKDQLKGLRGMALQFLDHRVLAAGDAHGDPVPRLNQLVPLHGGDKGIPDGFAIGFDETALGSLLRCQFPGHTF